MGDGEHLANGCDTAAAMDRAVTAIEALAAEVKQTRETFAPAAEALHGLGDAQKKLCAWIVGNRLKLAASVPVVLVGVGAISPNAAHLIEKLMKLWGFQ
jgi:hypothetical protein